MICTVPLPDAFRGDYTFGIQALLALFQTSSKFTTDVNACRVHVLPEKNPWTPGISDGVSIHTWLEESYPPFANASNMFVHFSFCDLVTDCDYLPRPFAALPPSLSPVSPSRRYTYVAWNGRADGYDSGQEHCEGCMQRGKDVVVPTGRNACGPLCGGTLDDLRRFTVWDADQQLETHVLSAYTYVKRWPTRDWHVFFSGQVHPLRMVGDADPMNDPSGRGEFYRLYNNRSDWSVTQSYDWEHNVAVKPMKHTMLEMMRNSTFCYSPLGRIGGDTDRYIAAIMTGCIPIMLSAVYVGGARQPYVLPFEDVLDWNKFAVIVDAADIPLLPELLESVDIVSKRAHMAHVWRRMLWTKHYGSHIGESGDKDAFDTLLDVLHKRVHSM